LQTDYLDVYQLHWPERKTNYFGQRGYTVQEDAWEDNIHAVLDSRWFCKIKHIGLSNENGESCVFWKKVNTNNLPRVKRFKILFIIEPSFLKMLPLKFACAKM
jgi:diketogulonate reductase-like aldo/keto reductase